MQSNLKTHVQPKKFFAMLTIICALLGVSIVFVSDLMIIPLAAFYASLLWFEPKAKLRSALLPFPILALSFIGGVISVFSVATAFCGGIILFFLYKKGATKAITALALTAFFILYLIVSLFIVICMITKEYSIVSAFENLIFLIEEIKEKIVSDLSNISVIDQNGENHYIFSKPTAELLILSVMRLLPAFVAILAFLLCGFTLKIFSRLIAHAEADEAHIRSWRFVLPALYAYFFGFVFVLSFFLGNGEDVVAASVQNLAYIFIAIFGYVGIRHLLVISSHVRNRFAFFVVLLFAFALLNVTALQILAFLGAYVTILYHRSMEHKNDKL